jgi:hypothetical protein
MAKRASRTSGLRSGNRAPESGQYEVRGPRGGATGHEVTAIRGKPLPPVEKRQSFTLTDKTKHSGKR